MHLGQKYTAEGHYKEISRIAIVKRIRAYRDPMGIERAGAIAEAMRTSMATNLKFVCIALHN